MPTATKTAAKKSAPKSKARLTKAQRVANFAKLLRKIGACKEAREFCKGKTAKEAWCSVAEISWMFYLVTALLDESQYAEFRHFAVRVGTWSRGACIKIAAKFPIESFAFYKERGL